MVEYLPSRLRNEEIASLRYVSVNTLRTHLRHIYGKLGVGDRDEAIDAATRLGLL